MNRVETGLLGRAKRVKGAVEGLGGDGFRLGLKGKRGHEVGKLSIGEEELSILVKEWGLGQTDELARTFLEMLALKGIEWEAM